MIKGKDLAVAYRIYPKVSKTPAAFKDNKYRLSELCLRSFKQCLEGQGINVRVFAILDNCPDEYSKLFRQYFLDGEIEFIKLDGIGNRKTFDLQMKLLLDQGFSENIYFAEDDYFYLPGMFSEMLDFLSQPGVDFITPYDHPDYYTLELHRHINYIKTHNNRHWRSAATTCMTFLTTKNNLKKAHRIFKSYTKRNLDSSLWLNATKYRIRNPISILSICINNKRFLKNIKKAWLDGWGWMHILFGRRWNLWAPIPSIATHMESAYLAPCIDWYKDFDRVSMEIEKREPITTLSINKLPTIR